MSILSSIIFPTVICSPTICYFSREKPLVKSTAPGSSFSYCPLRSTFICFYFRSINLKTQKYFSALYFICDLFIKSITTFSCPHAVSGAVTRKGLTTPLTRRVARCCYLCAGAVYVVVLACSLLLDWYLGSQKLREILTYAVLHHPILFGEIPTQITRITCIYYYYSTHRPLSGMHLGY